MKLIMTKQEFLQLRDIIVNIDNEKVSKEFNIIVTNQNPHIETAKTSDTLSLTVSDQLTTEIGKVLINHSKGLGKNLNVSLSGIPKLLTQGKKLLSDLGAVISSKH